MPNRTISTELLLSPELRHLGQVIRRGLVHPVEPVAPQQIGVGAPGEQRFQFRIVMREVVLREGHVGHALGHIALVFLGERVLAVLPMAEREHFGEVTCGDQARAGLWPPSQDLKVMVGTYLVFVHAGEAGVRLQINLVETIGQEAVFVLQVLREYAENLLGVIHLVDAVAVVQCAHRAPAQVHGGEHMGGGPVENRLELVPVVHIFERHMLYRRAGDHETVVIVVFERVEVLIELDEVVGGNMRGLMRGGLHEVDLDLQRRFGDQSQQLRFGFDLLGHQVQDHQFERTDALTLRFGFLQSEDALRIEDGSGRQAAGDLDRHAPIMSTFGITVQGIRPAGGSRDTGATRGGAAR